MLEALVVPLGFRRGAPSNATGCGSGIAPHDAAFALRLQDGKERGCLRQQIYANIRANLCATYSSLRLCIVVCSLHKFSWPFWAS